MKYDYILIRFGELTTKGKNRKLFVNQLYSNIKIMLRAYPSLKYQKTHDRMYIILNDEDAEAIISHLKHVFGIHSFSLAVKVNRDLNEMKAAAEWMMKDFGHQTFKIETRRQDKTYEYRSDEINRHLAGHLLSSGQYKVDVHHPDHRLKVEINKDCVYLMGSVIHGVGGYPLGSNGKALMMLSGGIDSPVASYLTMKRGVRVDGIHFASPPYTSPQSLTKVVDIASQLSTYSGLVKLFVVPFTKLQVAIYEHTDPSYAMIIMRRMMYRIAVEVAKQYHYLALVNGESIGQVASQTLDNMNVVNEVTSFPILRPLLTYDKIEIMSLARHIKTYDISIRPYEDCCTIFTPQNPTTKAKLHKVLYFESLFDYQSLIDECVENVTVQEIRPYQDEEDIF